MKLVRDAKKKTLSQAVTEIIFTFTYAAEFGAPLAQLLHPAWRTPNVHTVFTPCSHHKVPASRRERLEGHEPLAQVAVVRATDHPRNT